tara:strand:+ start:745 stop:1104 length:360 start_codon:yes stop_codon:yes gene_type:complete
MSDLSAVLRSLRPNNNWLIENETLNWEDDLALKPTDAEIEAKRIELQNTLPMKILRRERDNKLKNCDVYGLSDYPFANDTIKQDWITYRHKLRDLPTTASPQLDDEGNLTNVTWPTPPQ